MKRTKLHPERAIEYPPEKARKILEADGIYLTEDELKRFVDVLTLMAYQEKELIGIK